MKAMKRILPGGILLLLALTATEVAHSADPETVSPWMSEDPSDWPRIAMINQIEYTDRKHPYAACGFLVDTGDEVLAATAKHVLLYFKSGAMDSVSFAGTLKTWRMFPKDSPGDAVVIDRLVNEEAKEPLGKRIPPTRDGLLFTLRETTDAVQPLRLRSTPLRKGETVYVIGWRYPDEGTATRSPGPLRADGRGLGAGLDRCAQGQHRPGSERVAGHRRQGVRDRSDVAESRKAATAGAGQLLLGSAREAVR